MDTAHRNLLRKNRLALSEDLDAKTATSYLYSEDIISEHDKEDIETAKTQRDKSEKLLDILPKRGPHAFEVFLKFLDDKQPHLSKLLQGVPEGKFFGSKRFSLTVQGLFFRYSKYIGSFHVTKHAR